MSETISIIIPAYNIQDHLGPTLDSVLTQTYQDLEILVVNDGSTDGTAAVMEAYAAKDSRIRAIHKENGGVTSARLCGVAEATGAYIGFVDGDDHIEPEMYQRLLENLKQCGADISHCGYQMVFPSRVDYYYNTGKMTIQQGKQGCTDLLDGSFVEPALVNKLYRRELFDGLDAWMDRTVRINEDLLMNFYLFRQVRTAVFEDICPYHYVLRKGSASTSRLNAHKLQDPLKVLHLILDETADVPEWKQIVERRLIYQLVGSATISLGEQRELILPCRKAARKELRSCLGMALRGPFTKKLKMMAIWSAVCPDSYCWVHRIYARISGVEKKYEVR